MLPSLAAWVGTAVLAFAIARRVAGCGKRGQAPRPTPISPPRTLFGSEPVPFCHGRVAPACGDLAGCAAATLVLASPAHRAFATDIMLESLGACTTLLALYAYLRAVESPTRAAWRGVGLALTAVFFTKYNYWLLVAIALAADQVLARPGEAGRLCGRVMRRGVSRAWLVGQLRHPLTYALAGTAAFAIAVVAIGGFKGTILGIDITAPADASLLFPVYVVLVARVVLWYLRQGRTRMVEAGPAAHGVVAAHVLPLSVWFLLPHRLAYFLFYLSPANSPRARAAVAESVAFYIGRIAEDYHAWAATAWVAAMFALVVVPGLVGRRRPGASVLPLLVVVAAVLTVLHPHQLSRFVHSWIAVVWILAGAGASFVLGFVVKSARWRAAAAGVVAAAVALVHLPAWFEAGRSPEHGHHDLGPSTRDLTDDYLDRVAPGERVAFFATLPMKDLAGWSYLERFGTLDGLEVFVRRFGRDADENRRRFDAWVERTRAEAVVFVDVPAGSHFYFEGYPHYQQYRELLAGQSVFREAERRVFEDYGCKVSVWRRSGPPGRSDAIEQRPG